MCFHAKMCSGSTGKGLSSYPTHVQRENLEFLCNLTRNIAIEYTEEFVVAVKNPGKNTQVW